MISVSKLSRHSKHFPEQLLEIAEPPEQLYIRGEVDWKRTMLTVVGSRHASTYGKDVCKELISGLEGTSITIVSGLALGIDAWAHHCSLEANLPTIGFPGSGVLPEVLYPRSNVNLAEQIVSDGGAIISELEPDHKAAKWTFPRRNRLMSGISHAVLVIEAGERSGTLITARLALEYNRQLLVAPGSIFNPTSKGSNNLIKRGATVIMSSDDIVDALQVTRDIRSSSTIDVSSCSEIERSILQILSRSALTQNELARQIDQPRDVILPAITSLEIKGMVSEKSGAFYIEMKRCK